MINIPFYYQYIFWLFLAFFFGHFTPIHAQTDCINGKVVDETTMLPIADVHVWSAVTGVGTVTSADGVFKLCGLKGKEMVLIFSHTSYVTFTKTFKSLSHENIFLKRNEFLTEEVEVKGQSGGRIHEISPGQGKLRSSDILRLPAILGEADVVRALQQMPGIQSVSEGVGGIYVRGGGPGQNHVMLDGMELMNPLHLMGIYSVFNPITTSDVSVFKGHAPASIRGGLSSSIIVSSTSPFNKENLVQGAIGNIASNLTFSGKSKSGKFGVTVGFRHSYLELYKAGASLFLSDENNFFSQSFYRFYDFNGQAAFRPNASSSFALSWYVGSDDFMIDNNEVGYDAGTNYGNKAVALRWEKRVGDNKIFSAGMGYTFAWSDFSGEVLENDLEFESNHQAISINTQFLLEGAHHLFRAGGDATYFETMPQNMMLTTSDGITSHKDEFRNAEISGFVEDTYELSPLVSLYAGIRVHYYMSLGPYRFHNENSTVHFDNNELVDENYYWSPSLSLSYQFRRYSVLKMAWSRNFQMIHLATLSTMPLPNDIWMMSSPRLEPQNGHQYSLEVEQQFSRFSFTTGIFARKMQNQLIFNVNVGEEEMNFEDHFFHGDGRAYGMELSAKKETGTLQGSLNYSLSRSERSFEDIFEGEWFSDKFDRTHDLSAMISYSLNEQWALGAGWTYATGIAMTLPEGRMWMMGTIMNDYNGYNNFRLPAYHRLDLSASLKLKSQTFKESVLDFSVINLYNRANPYYLFYNVYKGESSYDIDIRASQVSLFPVMPSVSWKFKF